MTLTEAIWKPRNLDLEVPLLNGKAKATLVTVMLNNDRYDVKLRVSGKLDPTLVDQVNQSLKAVGVKPLSPDGSQMVAYFPTRETPETVDRIRQLMAKLGTVSPEAEDRLKKLAPVTEDFDAGQSAMVTSGDTLIGTEVMIKGKHFADFKKSRSEKRREMVKSLNRSGISGIVMADQFKVATDEEYQEAKWDYYAFKAIYEHKLFADPQVLNESSLSEGSCRLCQRNQDLRWGVCFDCATLAEWRDLVKQDRETIKAHIKNDMMTMDLIAMVDYIDHLEAQLGKTQPAVTEAAQTFIGGPIDPGLAGSDYDAIPWHQVELKQFDAYRPFFTVEAWLRLQNMIGMQSGYDPEWVGKIIMLARSLASTQKTLKVTQALLGQAVDVVNRQEQKQG